MNEAAPLEQLADVADLRIRAPYKLARRWLFLLAIAALSAGACWLLADILAADRLTAVEAVVAALFTVNFVWIALSFATAAAGAYLRAAGRDPIRLERRRPVGKRPALSTRTVIVMPIYNEPVERVFAGLEATFRSLERTGQLDAFDFFVLSDTRDPDIWVSEELAWADLVKRLFARGKIFYRRRPENVERKSGNLMDFCESWGAAYDYMVVLDADSVMSGDALVRMAALMQANPDTGLIQSPPQPMGAQTLFARILQFIAHIHGPTMTAGLAFWQIDNANYWGHNAIVRMAAFIDCCGLPILPGRPPLGGPILSHDFVEAALMRRAGWKVWLVPDIEGSWEELPPNIPSYAARDRRWAQGNLQHARLLGGQRFTGLSRLNLFMGVMSFVSSPLWLLLLISATVAGAETAAAGPHAFFPEGEMMFPAWPVDRSGEMILLLCVTLGMLLLPKLISVALVLRDAQAQGQIGGRSGLCLSTALELVFSALLAPVMMLLHTVFVTSILAGRPVGWEAQARSARGMSWNEALRAHRWHMAIGLGWSGLAFWLAQPLFYWLLPVTLGMVFAPVLSRVTSRADLGAAAARHGLFLTPAQARPPEELQALQAARATATGPGEDPLRRLLEDPFASALHMALLPDTEPDARTRAEIGILYEKLARLGPESLSQREKVTLLSYPVKPLDRILAGRTPE